MAARSIIASVVFSSVSALVTAMPAQAQGPDVIVGGLAVSGANGSNQNDIVSYGQSSGINAYSVATTSCNVGTSPLLWLDCGGGASCNNHPVISQSMFRLKDGKFEQIGQAWLKHGFCALSENLCGGCAGTNCDSLGVGCSDPYTATRNGSGGAWPLGPKSEVNATTGFFPFPAGSSPSGGTATIRGRLQVHTTDIDPAQNAGALYFIEGQYVTEDDALAGNAMNNASWRQIQVIGGSPTFVVSAAGFPTNQEESVIWAWRANDPAVKILNVDIVGEGGAGVNGRFHLGYRHTDLGGGIWRYEYALQNKNSDRSGGSFSVPIPPGVNPTNIGFHDVDYHSGEPYSGTDWSVSVGAGSVTWETEAFATNQNANAIRWGTMYNFRFDANASPVNGSITMGLFKPGTPSALIVSNVIVPGEVQLVDGACCLSFGCAVLTESICDANLGTFLGLGEPCVPDPCAPPAPADVAASNSISQPCSRTEVSWTADAGATSCEIYRNSVDDSGTATLIHTAASCDGANVYEDDSIDPSENGSTWFYWVKACNGVGCSDFSSPSTSATLQVKGDFEPNGLFNGLDANGFVAAALAGDSCADLAAPFGTIDAADTQAMVDRWCRKPIGSPNRHTKRCFYPGRAQCPACFLSIPACTC